MKYQILIAGMMSCFCSLSAHAQDSIANTCAEFLAQDQWPAPMSDAERDAFKAQIRASAVSVKEMIGQFSGASELASIDTAEPDESTESRIGDEANVYPGFDDWRNPVVAISAEGVEVSSSALENGSLYAPVVALQCILANLPVSAWPQGRVVRAGPPSLLGSVAELVPISRNQEAAQAVFDELQIEVLWWVS